MCHGIDRHRSERAIVGPGYAMEWIPQTVHPTPHTGETKKIEQRLSTSEPSPEILL